jgi:hypothetical protein
LRRRVTGFPQITLLFGLQRYRTHLLLELLRLLVRLLGGRPLCGHVTSTPTASCPSMVPGSTPTKVLHIMCKSVPQMALRVMLRIAAVSS